MRDSDSLPDTLPSLLRRSVQGYGNAPAIATMAGTITYRQIAERSARLAKVLLLLGVTKGTHVGVLAGNTVFWIQSLFACARVGAVMVPMSTLAAPPELTHILRHSDCHTLLAARHFLGRDYGETIAHALPALSKLDASSDRRLLRFREAPFLRSIWLDDVDGLPWANSITELLSSSDADPALDSEFLDEIESEVSPSDDAVIIYTSGSTALPKAAIHTHGPMARHVRVVADAQLARSGERVLCLLPMFWVGGITMLLEVFVKGGCIVLPDGVSVRSVVDTLREVGADVVHGWLPQRRAIRDLMEAEGLDVSGIRNIQDERLPDGSLKQQNQIPNSLGMTESFGPHGALPVGSVLPDHRRGAYAPSFGGFERRVVDPVTGDVLPPSHAGELQIRGGSLMRSYHKRERSTAFTPDGFFPTQDLVRIEPDGYMYFEGRTGDMLKTKGANVSRLEVEEALRKVPGVAEAFVCGLPDSEAGQLVVAAATPVAGNQLTESSIKAALRGLLAPYKIPTHIVLIGSEDMLWTATGKIRVSEMTQFIGEKLEGLRAGHPRPPSNAGRR